MKKIFVQSLAVLILLSGSLIAQTNTVSNLFKQVRSSVVVIKIKQQSPTQDFRMVTHGGLGSGVVISKDGRILTAAHVVQTAFDVEVVFENGMTVPAEIIGSEPAADVAMIKVPSIPAGITIAKMGDSDIVEVGDPVFVVGAPYGLSYTLTVGHISARHKPDTLTGDMNLAEFFQTDAAINHGNSGGPMFNMNGEVIGIVSYILSQSGGFEGLGFVASTKTAKELLLDTKSFWGGMEGQVLEGPLANIFNLPQKTAILVQKIAPGSPAYVMGLQGGSIPLKIADFEMFVGGDFLLSVGEISYAEENAYFKIREYLGSKKKGDKITAKILRAGVVRTLEYTVER
jgi:S1-C subfamily serine protease